MQEDKVEFSKPAASLTQEIARPASNSGVRKKGLGARLRQQQAFTGRKNQQGKQAIKQRIADELKDLNINLSVDEFLKTLTATEEVNRPPLEVTVGLGVLNDLCQETVNYMASQEIEVHADDVRVLKQITTLQIRAKVGAARAKTAVGSQPINDPYFEKTKKHLTKIIASQDFMVSQIGIVEHMRQKFVPKLVAPPNFEVPEGKVATDIMVNGLKLYVPVAFSENPFACPVPEHTYVDESSVLNIDAAVQHYTGFVNRVSRKLAGCIKTIDFANPVGSMAQLVGSKPVTHRGQTYIDTWCTKDVPTTILAIGGGLRFGLGSNDPLHHEAIMCANWTLDSTAFLMKLQERNRRIMR